LNNKDEHLTQEGTTMEENDLTVEKIQENLLKLDEQYLNSLIPRHQLLQAALEQLRHDEQMLLELQIKANTSDVDIVNTSEKSMKQPDVKRFSDAAADRLAHALFQVDDESSDTSNNDCR
jgi:hypothetical protein